MSVDLHQGKKSKNYFLTLSPRQDLSSVHLAVVVDWHKLRTPCILVSEERTDGVEHYHSVFGDTASRAAKVTEKFNRLMDAGGLPYVKGVTLKIRAVTDLIGMFHYLTKDLGDGKPLVLSGWKLSWIRQQCLENLKKIPKKMLMRNDRLIGVAGSVGLVLEYSKRKGIPLTGKESFRRCLMEMAKEGYRFEKIKIRQLYVHVMAQCGDARAFGAMIDNELQFL